MNCLSPHDSYCTLPIHIITVQGQRRELGMVTQRFTVLCDTVNPNGSIQQKKSPIHHQMEGNSKHCETTLQGSVVCKNLMHFVQMFI